MSCCQNIIRRQDRTSAVPRDWSIGKCFTDGCDVRGGRFGSHRTAPDYPRHHLHSFASWKPSTVNGYLGTVIHTWYIRFSYSLTASLFSSLKWKSSDRPETNAPVPITSWRQNTPAYQIRNCIFPKCDLNNRHGGTDENSRVSNVNDINFHILLWRKLTSFIRSGTVGCGGSLGEILASLREEKDCGRCLHLARNPIPIVLRVFWGSFLVKIRYQHGWRYREERAASVNVTVSLNRLSRRRWRIADGGRQSRNGYLLAWVSRAWSSNKVKWILHWQTMKWKWVCWSLQYRSSKCITGRSIRENRHPILEWNFHSFLWSLSPWTPSNSTRGHSHWKSIKGKLCMHLQNTSTRYKAATKLLTIASDFAKEC